MKQRIGYLFLLFLPAAISLQAQETDLSAKGTANCYIVTTPGHYSFETTVQGCSALPTDGGERVEVLWSDVPDMISDLRLDASGRIAFTVGDTCGNSVIALLRSDGTACWSWHIWYPDGVPAEEVYAAFSGMTYVVQDRPLGAVSSDGVHPLLYQWGRKDPFPSVREVYAAGTQKVPFLTRWRPVPARVAPAYAVQHPATFVHGGNWCDAERSELHALWGDPAGYMSVYRTGGGWSAEKSRYDPCPAGYRVANSNAFSGFTLTGRGSNKPSDWNVVGPWRNGWMIQRNPLDLEGTFYAVTGWREGATGELAGQTRGVVWCSNPSERSSDAMRRLFYHQGILLTVSRHETAMAFPVRCVREDDADVVFAVKHVPEQIDVRTYEDLSAAGTANCYIVTLPGNYRFRAAVRGGSKRSVGKCVTASLVWADRPGLLRGVKLDDKGYLCFSVLRNLGNAIVAVHDATGEILWSWHIWCAGESPKTDAVQNYDGTVYEVMDRNLGAFSACPGEESCMLYQWGRKDPFPYVTHVYDGEDIAVPKAFLERWPPVGCYATGDDKKHNNQEYVIRNPATFVKGDERLGNWFPYEEQASKYLWGDPLGYAAEYRNGGWSDAKSINDPCPVGYRVANVNTFSGMTTTGRGSDDQAEFRSVGTWKRGWWFRCRPHDDRGAWYPVTGWRDKRTGNPGGGTRGALWCSNPTGSAGTEWRRVFFHETTVLVASKEGSAQAYGVRCVRE